MKNRVRELRLQKGVTQAYLAKVIGVAQNTLSYWEQGKYDIDTQSLQLLADFFGCSVDHILLRADGAEEHASKPAKPTITDRDLQVALFGGDEEVTDAMWEEVKNFAAYVKSKNKKEE